MEETIMITNQDENTRWQVKQLPLIRRMIIALTIFFLLISLAQLFYLQIKISRQDSQEISIAVQSVKDTGNITLEQKIDLLKMKALILLENESLERRHHQANTSLMSRIWIKYLGFVTGMILAIVGALFILGKFREKDSTLNAKTEAAEFSLSTASPGIFLAVLGTILMSITIFINHEIEVNDGLIYINNAGSTGASASEYKKPSVNTDSLINLINNNKK